MQFRHLFRFSLRTFLLLVTVFLIWLGFQLHRTRQEATAVASIKALGGQIGYAQDDADSVLRKWLQPVFGPGRLVYVSFQLVPVTDDDLKELPQHLRKLPRFGGLSLDRTKISDVTVERIKYLRNFTTLNLDSTRITDVGIEHLMEMPQLETLAIVYADCVSEAGLRRLRDHPRLGRVVWNTHKEPAEKEWATYNQLIDELRRRGGPGL